MLYIVPDGFMLSILLKTPISSVTIWVFINQSDLHADRSGFDASTKMSPQKVLANSMSRTNSSPGNFDSSIDRPMRLAEIYIAAEHALKQTISNPELLKSLSSSEEFEVSSWADGFISMSLSVCFILFPS